MQTCGDQPVRWEPILADVERGCGLRGEEERHCGGGSRLVAFAPAGHGNRAGPATEAGPMRAGNSGEDACLASPASAPAAITVGASTSSDAMANFSNWGNANSPM